MKINIGDQVRFLDDVGGGKVTALVGKDMVTVETSDGFEIPTYIKNLVVVTPASENNPAPVKGKSNAGQPSAPVFTEKTREGFIETDQVRGNDHPQFVFALVPDNPANPPSAPIQLYLVNDCNYTLLYHFAVKRSGKYETVDAGTLEPNTKVNLETLHPRMFNELPDYCFQLLSFRKEAKQLEEPVQKEVTVSPVKLFKSSSFIRNGYFKNPAMILSLVAHPLTAELETLSDHDFRQISTAKEPQKSTTPVSSSGELVEIDLHIGQLLDDFRGLENSDMLKVQLDHFRKEMDNAIAKGAKRIVFIHGVGDGVLKNEVRRELQRKYPKYPFQDASFREYGFGATMVLLKK